MGSLFRFVFTIGHVHPGNIGLEGLSTLPCVDTSSSQHCISPPVGGGSLPSLNQFPLRQTQINSQLKNCRKPSADLWGSVPLRSPTLCSRWPTLPVIRAVLLRSARSAVSHRETPSSLSCRWNLKLELLLNWPCLFPFPGDTVLRCLLSNA